MDTVTETFSFNMTFIPRRLFFKHNHTAIFSSRKGNAVWKNDLYDVGKVTVINLSYSSTFIKIHHHQHHVYIVAIVFVFFILVVIATIITGCLINIMIKGSIH